MRAVIFTDATFAARERRLLAHLELGLADEGLRVVHAVPASLFESFGRLGLFSTPIPYIPKGSFLTRRSRVDEFLTNLASLLKPDELTDLDLVHAFGKSSWPFAASVAHRTGARLVLEAHNPSLIPAAVRLYRTHQHHTPPDVFAPDLAIRRLLLRTMPATHVHHVPWGVSTTPALGQPAQAPTESQIPALVLLASSKDPPAILNVLRAIPLLKEQHPELNLFLDAQLSARLNLWKHARKLGITSSLSLIQNLEGRRDPALLGHILLQPESVGFHHSFTLDAMAAGMLVCAAPDTNVEYLIDATTCHTPEDTSPQAWANAISTLWSDRDKAAKLRDSARAYILKNRTLSHYIDAVTRSYSSILHRPAPHTRSTEPAEPTLS